MVGFTIGMPLRTPEIFAQLVGMSQADAEWTTLENFLGGKNVAGGKMKTPSSLWQTPNTAATNESGFSGLPGGNRNNANYYHIGNFGFWWSSTENSATNAWYQNLGYNGGKSYRGSSIKYFGYSVRCIKD
jgi:uncharacterized protein (TIGR02145 family)